MCDVGAPIRMEGRCPAFDLSLGDRFNVTEPIQLITDMKQTLLGVRDEILACDGDESSTIITTRCRGNTINCHLVFEIISCFWRWWKEEDYW